MPTVSVLMPVYNAQLYLVEAIDSILSQSYSDWELVIVNDGSTDDSESIIARYKADPRIKYYDNSTNLGLIATLNKGIDLCRGRYIARMDADDISMPERLQQQFGFLEAHSDYIMCGANAIVIDNNGEKTGQIRNLTEDKYLQINLLFSDPFIHPTMMIRRSSFMGNRYDIRYKHVEDYELWCRLAKVGKIANLGLDLLRYRWHQTNVSVVHHEVQSQLTDKILRSQINSLGIDPTESELFCHKITFQLYDKGNSKQISLTHIDDISQWFLKLVKANHAKNIYNEHDFIAYIWSRWIVLCLSQKKYDKIFKSPFISYNPVVLTRLANLLLHLKNK